MLRRYALAALSLASAALAPAAEFQELDASNYERLVPAGKEVDAIYGDFVLRNDELIAVVAHTAPGRKANMTVRNSAGGVIDLTLREKQSDQLSCFYPGGGAYELTERIDWPADWDQPAEDSAAVAFTGEARGRDRRVTIRVGYELRDGEAFLRVVSDLTNRGDEPLELERADGFRLDGPFKHGAAESIGLVWSHEVDWRQAYGLLPLDAGDSLAYEKQTARRRPKQAVFASPNDAAVAPGESVVWSRALLAGADSLTVQATARTLRGEELATGRLIATAAGDPVADAYVTVERDGETIGYGRTNDRGAFTASVPEGEYRVTISANGHEDRSVTGYLPATRAAIDADAPVELSAPAYAEARVTDGAGRAIPTKVALYGENGTPDPDFGPDSEVFGVKNLRYTPNGKFRCKLRPGDYRWVATYGPEHDAAYGEFTVAAGETATIEASLPRVVDSTGWLSSELHSHSSPSGDNTASQAGRVLNLLAEHLEFCPCTEHQRVDIYDESLAAFDAQHLMLTCPGMELTGSPLPLNHQNAFPLIHKPRTQDGGGPQTSSNPVEQIKRLAGWDNHSEKVVQTNHPDVAQMIGDRDENGEPDQGFEAMFGYMDVMEVHPPELIFEPLRPEEPTESGVGTGGWEGRGNTIVNWLQMLNLGYRVTGVVNTDAHYNWHGSGWIRNWVRSATDEPTEASVTDLVHEFEHGHVVMSNGPFMSVAAMARNKTVLPGDDLTTDGGKAKLRVVVRCPNWIEINRVQLFLNGRPVEGHNYTARTHEAMFAAGPNVFDEVLEVAVDEDTHVVVACCGEGKSIGPMYGGEDWGRNLPVAVANPIFLDTDGDADGDGAPFEANGDGLGLPLPRLDDLKPSHGHTHPNHRH